MFKNILVVCIGNICRSPFAHALLVEHFKQHDIDAKVDSAGIGAMVGDPPSQGSLDILSERGLDFSHHRAQQVSQELLSQADLILTMEEDQQAFLCRHYPFVRGKVHLLGKWVGTEVIDPYKKPQDAYTHMAKQIDECLQGWISRCWQPVTTD